MKEDTEKMTTRKFTEIDDTVKIDFEVPADLKELFELAEEADLTGGAYIELADDIDTVAKNCYAAGELTAGQWDTIIRRYKQW